MDKLYNLYAARELTRYFNALQYFTANSFVAICAQGTPCGAPDFDEHVSDAICSIGCKIKLHNKMHHSYIAIINKGELLYEQISKTETLCFQESKNGKNLNVVSKNFNTIDWYKVSKGISDDSYIEYGDTKIICERGLTVATFDSETGELVHSIRFDTFLTVNRKKYVAEDKNWAAGWIKKQYPQVKLVTYCLPNPISYETDELSDDEILAYYYAEKEKRKTECEIALGLRSADEENAYIGPFILNNMGKSWFALNDYYEHPHEIIETCTPPVSYTAYGGAKRFFDVAGKHLNITNGHRVTLGSPAAPAGRIYAIGDCMTFGFAVRDEGTIASKLQYILNKSYDENTIGVENHGIFTVSTDMFLEFTSIFISLPIKKRDILLVQTTGEADINCADIFARPHDYGEVYWDCYHLTERGNTIVAKKIYDYLRSTRVLSVCKRDSDFGNEYITNSIPNDNHALRYGFSEREGERLNEYKRKLAALYKEIRAKHGPNPNIGAAAMNCNPFTLGHLHLIETAAAKVDHLVIFVVREDKSEFPFADRIELVKRGTEHIPNISVLESGEFIGSVKTFSAYFNKEASQDVPIDASLDACIFGAEISPALRIKTRFVGDEPLDKVTRRYNETLVAILPRYGVRVEIIPRHSIDGAVVSASTVRRLIAERKFDEIAKIVPAATYEHLLERTASVPH